MSGVSIGQASMQSGVSAKTIRHYESIGLIRAVERGDNQYRRYGKTVLHELAFIRRARDLGFAVKDIRQLLALWRDKGRNAAEVKAIALRQIAALDAKAMALRMMSQTLHHLAANCHGETRPDCPILQSLDGQDLAERNAEAA